MKRPDMEQDLADTLTGEMLFYSLIGKILYTYPERDWLSTITQENIFAESPLEISGQSDMQAGLNRLHAWEIGKEGGLSEDEFSDLLEDYTRLFIGPGRVLAPPWESVYFNDERMVFQQQTLQVREWYRRFGLQAESLHREPDDHIGIELAFLAHLTQLGLQALERGDEIGLSSLLEARSEFMQGHLLQWGPRFCGLVLKESRTDFYQGVALLLRGKLSEIASSANLPAVQEAK
jgi:TorA maturation chaperone TorD